MSDKAKFGYLAGILDGEGCLTIGAGQKETCTNYNSIVVVQNTSKKLIDWLQAKFGGSVYLSKKETDKTKAAYMWRILKKKDIEILLLAVLPYLVVKREQAKILLEFVRLPREANNELRAVYFQQLKVLNARGVSVETNTQEGTIHIPRMRFLPKIEPELIGDNESTPDVNQGSDKCNIPPYGWWCSRKKGHGGPCAARLISDSV